MDSEKIKLNIKLITSNFGIEVDKNGTILDIKKVIKTSTNNEESSQKLIYKGKPSFLLLGKILKDADTIASYNIQEGDSLHLVVKKPQDQSKPVEAPNTDSSTTGTTGTAGTTGAGMPGMGMPGMGMPGMGMPGMGIPGMGMPGMSNEFLQAQMQAVF